VLIALLSLFLALINFITDLLWFNEMKYLSVFLIKLFTQLQLGIPVFLVVGLLSFVYLLALRKGYYKKIESADNDMGTVRKLKIGALVLSFLAAALVTYFVITTIWFEFLKFFNSTEFNIKDPLFGLDVSFYLFRLEFIKQLNTIAIGVIVAFALLTVAYYMLMISFRKPQMFETAANDNGRNDDDDDDDDYDARSTHRNAGGYGAFGDLNVIFEKLGQMLGGQQSMKKTPQQNKQFTDDNFMQILNIASKQLTAIGILFFLMLGVNFFLKQFDLLYSSTGVLYGAGFTDVNVTLWMYRVLVVLSILGAIGFSIGIARKKFRTILTIPVIMILVGALGMGGGYIIQNYYVSPDEINKESIYLARNIKYTQEAYNLHNVKPKEFPVSNTLSRADIDNNSETILNIRINDYDPVRRFYNNFQTLRPYYTFTDVFVDRYMINGGYTQVYIAAREIDDSTRSPIPPTFLNRHIKYTHGYGITLSRVDKISERGLPEMLIRNIPPQSDVREIQIKNPAIYFGKITNDFILVKTTEPEFDYPIGIGEDHEGSGRNAEVFYEGEAGIKLNLINKTLFSIRERNLRIFVSSALTSESKIIINRNIEKRVRTIMPRLTYDPDPYMVTVNGNLYWIVDAYTTSTQYPYSEPYNRAGTVNYIRNSVKIVIDAYNGNTMYYLVDKTDPIAATYQKIFPTLFKDFADMPEEIKKHIRYPNLMLNIQASVYRRYHMSDVTMFYQNEDLWDIATEVYGTSDQMMIPNYYIMKLPGESSTEFVNTIPFTPRGRLNMSALLLARNDGENYGELILFQFPKDRQIPGPRQVDAQIDQDEEISRDFTLWGSAGSIVNRGNMFIVPIENSLLYVEPVYLEAESSSIPEVRRVIVAYGVPDGDGVRIAYKATLNEALEELFGKPSGTTQTPGPGTVTKPAGDRTLVELIALASEAFENAQRAQKDGNWAAYGRYLDQLEIYLDQLATGDYLGE